MNENTLPVLMAVGESSYRVDDLAAAQEPVDLIIEALKDAERDCGQNFLASLDMLAVIGIVSWRYSDPAKLVCERLGIHPKAQIKADMGGEKSTRLIHDAALQVQRGELQAAAIVGGEAQNALRKAKRAGHKFDWTPRASVEDAWGDLKDTTLGVSRQAHRLGVRSPAHIYPFFEMARAHADGETPAETVRAAASLWAEYSAVSPTRSHAWHQAPFSAEQIATVSAENRMVTLPYPKWLVANDSVNQGAAVIVASLAFAKRLGVSEDKLIYLRGGAAARNPDDFMLRTNFAACPAQKAVLERVSEIAESAANIDLLELYSCFPVVPKLARDTLLSLGLAQNAAPTVAGGLTFFGGPLNNYMTHAACAMVQRLRAGDGDLGLLYAQGGVMTKHHGLLLSRAPTDQPLDEAYSVQDRADADRAAPPDVLTSCEGPAVVETYTVQYDREGMPAVGHVILRTPSGARTLAAVGTEDQQTLAHLTDLDKSAVGQGGVVRDMADQGLRWTAD